MEPYSQPLNRVVFGQTKLWSMNATQKAMYFKYATIIKTFLVGITADVLRMRLNQVADTSLMSLKSFLNYHKENIISALRNSRSSLILVFPPSDISPDLFTWNTSLLCLILRASNCLNVRDQDDVIYLSKVYKRYFNTHQEPGGGTITRRGYIAKREWFKTCAAVQRLVEAVDDPELIKELRTFIIKVEMEGKSPRARKETQLRLESFISEIISGNALSKNRDKNLTDEAKQMERGESKKRNTPKLKQKLPQRPLSAGARLNTYMDKERAGYIKRKQRWSRPTSATKSDKSQASRRSSGNGSLRADFHSGRKSAVKIKINNDKLKEAKLPDSCKVEMHSGCKNSSEERVTSRKRPSSAVVRTTNRSTINTGILKRSEVCLGQKEQANRRVVSHSSTLTRDSTNRSRPGSANRSRPDSVNRSRPGSADRSNPGSADRLRPGSANGSRPGSANRSRPGSANRSRPGSAKDKRPVEIGINEGTKIQENEKERENKEILEHAKEHENEKAREYKKVCNNKKEEENIQTSERRKKREKNSPDKYSYAPKNQRDSQIKRENSMIFKGIRPNSGRRQKSGTSKKNSKEEVYRKTKECVRDAIICVPTAEPDLTDMNDNEKEIKDKPKNNKHKKGKEYTKESDGPQREETEEKTFSCLEKFSLKDKPKSEEQIRDEKRKVFDENMKKIANEVLVHQKIHEAVKNPLLQDKEFVDEFFAFLNENHVTKKFLRAQSIEPRESWNLPGGIHANLSFFVAFVFRHIRSKDVKMVSYVVEKMLLRMRCKHAAEAKSVGNNFKPNQDLLEDGRHIFSSEHENRRRAYKEMSSSMDYEQLRSKSRSRSTSHDRRSSTPKSTNRSRSSSKKRDLPVDADEKSKVYRSTCITDNLCWKCTQKDLALMACVNWSNRYLCDLLVAEGVLYKEEHLSSAVKANDLISLVKIVDFLKNRGDWNSSSTEVKDALFLARKLKMWKMVEFLTEEAVEDDRIDNKNMCMPCYIT